MAELLIKIPEHQLPFFMALLERLQFVEIEKINDGKQTKEQFLHSFEESLQEAQLHIQGNIRLPKIEEVLNEL